MDSLMDVVQSILGAGPSVMLPIIIFIVGIIFRVPLKKAIISGITVGIGMIGINLVITVLTTNVGPAAQAMVERFGLNLTIIDAGWPAVSAGTWAQPIAAVMAATGYIVTKSFFFGILCGILFTIIIQIIADKTAPKVQEYYGLEGISITTGSAQGYAVLALPVGWLVDKIPGINKLDVKPETIQKRFGIFGEPMIMGIIIGMFLGLLGGYDFIGILQIGMNMGGVMFLMPRMVKILMEGLIPIQEGAQKLLQSRYGDREIYLGMDAALATGSPAALSTGLLMVPITLFLAVILPGNRVLPFGDLATIPFFAALVVPSRKGNILHSVISLTVVMAVALLMATNFAPVITEMAQGIVKFPDGAAEITNLDTGGNFLKWIFLKLSELVAQVM